MMTPSSLPKGRSPILRGSALALLAAALFGLSTPLVQRFGQGLGPFATAALLYAGAALVAFLQRRGSQAEAPLRRADIPRLLAMVATGAVVGPVALAWGLQRTSGASASLLLTLEAVFTAVLAWRWYGEVLDGRVKTAVALLLAGGALLVIDQGLTGQVQLLGLLAVAVATVAWGVDNTLSRGVADRDPGQVVVVKAAVMVIMVVMAMVMVMVVVSQSVITPIRSMDDGPLHSIYTGRRQGISGTNFYRVVQILVLLRSYVFLFSILTARRGGERPRESSPVAERYACS